MPYPIKKYKDIYSIENVGTSPIEYTLHFNKACDDCCDSSTEIFSDILKIKDTHKLPLSEDGEYILNIDGNITTIRYYLNFQNRIIEKVEELLCDECNNCACEDNPVHLVNNKCVIHQELFNSINILNYLKSPHYQPEDFCNYSCGYYAFLQKAFKFYECLLLKEICVSNNNQDYLGQFDEQYKTFKKIIAIYYLSYYFEERFMALDEEEIQYIDNKFNICKIKLCINSIGISFNEMQTLFEESRKDCKNTPPTVDSSEVNLYIEDFPEHYTFSFNSFALNFIDTQNNQPNEVEIVQIPSQFINGIKFQGNPISPGFKFSIFNSHELTTANPIDETKEQDAWAELYFRTSDDNENPLFSTVSKIVFNIKRKVKVEELVCNKIFETLGDLPINQPVNQSFQLSYNGGNGQNYPQQIIDSQKVNGLILTVQSGTLNNGDGEITINVSGTPTNIGSGSFNLNFGGNSCGLLFNVINQNPSSVGDNTINLGNRINYTFSIADFTTNTTPPYSDPEGDTAQRVQIGTLNIASTATLELNGIDVTVNQIINLSDIGNLVFSAPNVNAASQSTFTFGISDKTTGTNNFIF